MKLFLTIKIMPIHVIGMKI